jgi:hypothetical protein
MWLWLLLVRVVPLLVQVKERKDRKKVVANIKGFHIGGRFRSPFRRGFGGRGRGGGRDSYVGGGRRYGRSRSRSLSPPPRYRGRRYSRSPMSRSPSRRRNYSPSPRR